MNHIGGIISECINLFNQQIEKLIQSRNIYFFEGRAYKFPQIIWKTVCEFMPFIRFSNWTST